MNLENSWGQNAYLIRKCPLLAQSGPFYPSGLRGNLLRAGSIFSASCSTMAF